MEANGRGGAEREADQLHPVSGVDPFFTSPAQMAAEVSHPLCGLMQRSCVLRTLTFMPMSFARLVDQTTLKCDGPQGLLGGPSRAVPDGSIHPDGLEQGGVIHVLDLARVLLPFPNSVAVVPAIWWGRRDN